MSPPSTRIYTLSLHAALPISRLDGPPLTHAGAYAAHSATTLVGGVDPDPAACARFESRWGVPCTAELEAALGDRPSLRSEEHTSELQSHVKLVRRLLLEKKKL